MPVIPTEPLRRSTLNLDISGVAGFFGGDVAVSAMGTVNIYQGRKWLGWYNMPGSYEIAKRYGRLARSRIWSGLYPGGHDEPAVLFELDGTVGPRYRGVYSGTVMAKTGHIARLVVSESKELPQQTWTIPAGARETSPIAVTIVDLHVVPAETIEPHIMTKWSASAFTSALSCIPMLASAGTCIACAFVEDWLCFAMIAIGMFCSGFSCFVIGSGTFAFRHPKPAQGAPLGDGILDDNNHFVILRGEEGAVNPITRGAFSLTYRSAPDYSDIGLSSLFLTLQFLVQLLVVPQGTIFGQIMFLSSLGVSWLYNSFLSSLDKRSIQRRILFKDVLGNPRTYKYVLPTRTAMAVFVLLVLARPREPSSQTETPVAYGEKTALSSPRAEQEPLGNLLNDLLPNDTEVWTTWKRDLLVKIDKHVDDLRHISFDAPVPSAKESAELLDALHKDSLVALAAYQAYREKLEEDARNSMESIDGKRTPERKDRTSTNTFSAMEMGELQV
ncbi:hypothetical protein BD309DRAFT_946048 [Dichomitus squalens]|nr:hypothetical protein BD309DRAFT_946048 [Dichomitus squalens]